MYKNKSYIFEMNEQKKAVSTDVGCQNMYLC